MPKSNERKSKKKDKAAVSRPGSIELVSILKQLDVFAQRTIIPPELSKAAREQIIQKIGQDPQDIEKRLSGLRAEDEFTLMSLLLGNAEQITRLEQKQLLNWTKYAVPDILMAVRVPKQLIVGDLSMLQRLLVDVKTTEDQKVFLLPVETFNKLEKFSRLYRPIPLYFAVRMGKPGPLSWHLVSAAGLLKVSKKVNARVRGQEEECFSCELVDLLKEDLSGIWLSNYTVLIPTGFVVKEVYRTRGDGPFSDATYGTLLRMEVRSPGGEKVIEFDKGDVAENILLREVLSRLKVGDTTIKELPNGREVTCECAVNYSVPFYWLVLDTYLDLREKFEPHISRTPSQKPTVDYFVSSFSDFDRNLSSAIRAVVWKLSEERLIVPIKMIPERYF